MPTQVTMRSLSSIPISCLLAYNQLWQFVHDLRSEGLSLDEPFCERIEKEWSVIHAMLTYMRNADGGPTRPRSKGNGFCSGVSCSGQTETGPDAVDGADIWKPGRRQLPRSVFCSLRCVVKRRIISFLLELSLPGSSTNRNLSSSYGVHRS